eukprot:c47257_g1_i1 orf=78-275(+)
MRAMASVLIAKLLPKLLLCSHLWTQVMWFFIEKARGDNPSSWMHLMREERLVSEVVLCIKHSPLF